MSRVRTRPTRAETRQRLFDAAAELFQRSGIGAASIDAISAAAGLTRGAFYSNFANKDELIVAMLEDHVERSVRHHREVLERHPSPGDFVNALRTAERSRKDPLGRAPLLHLELILFVARSSQHRAQLRARLRTRRALVAEIIEAFNRRGGPAVDAAWASAMLLALEDGFRLHRLIDPQGVPAESFFESLARLQQILKPGGGPA
jgi:AcrR family transcriptional regulator